MAGAGSLENLGSNYIVHKYYVEKTQPKPKHHPLPPPPPENLSLRVFYHFSSFFFLRKHSVSVKLS